MIKIINLILKKNIHTYLLAKRSIREILMGLIEDISLSGDVCLG
jgi:hypothetical protein